jgi:fatty-acyl-CoA synthase
MTPDAVAVSWQGGEWTYAQLRDRAARLATGLRAAGVGTGDRVAYLGPNHPVYLDILFACGQLGAVFVPINFRLTPAEIDYVLADSGATVLIHTAEYAATVAALPDTAALRVVEAGEVEVDALAEQEQEIDLPVDLADPCLIMYTSGSTGRPKGAVLTHGNLTWNSMNVLIETDLCADERALVTAPLFHIAALAMTCLPILLKGGTVLLRGAFDPGAVLASIERERVTMMFGVPAMFDAMSAHPDWARTDLSSLRRLLCGGSSVPTETIRRYLDRGVPFAQGYGMTETSPGTLYLGQSHVADKAGSAGVPSFYTDVRIVDLDGADVSEGERGEVVISGPNVMRGYWQRPEATSAAVQEGWFHSGDVATRDKDGHYYIVDRLKDMIISGGENIYPAEIENELRSLPGVAACAVIGVPDPKWGEVGRAIVVAAPGVELDAADLLGLLRQRLAGYKVPASVVFVDSLPTTGSGKVRKSDLRERYGA